MELLNDEKRLFFNQPTSPTVPGGGGKSGCVPGTFFCLSKTFIFPPF